MDKKIKTTCHVDCPYFPQRVRPQDIKKEEIVDGVKFRKVVRRCGYDNKIIKTWNHTCPLEKFF